MLSWNALILVIGEREPTVLLIQNLTETTSLSYVNFFPLNETCSHVIKYLLVIRCKWRSSFTILFRLHRNRQWQKRRLHNRTTRFVFLHVQYMHADFVIENGWTRERQSMSVMWIHNLIHLVPKWLQFYYSFVYLQISPCCLERGIMLFNFEFKNEATRANLQENKRILKWRPFWNKVYSCGLVARNVIWL